MKINRTPQILILCGLLFLLAAQEVRSEESFPDLDEVATRCGGGKTYSISASLWGRVKGAINLILGGNFSGDAGHSIALLHNKPEEEQISDEKYKEYVDCILATSMLDQAKLPKGACISQNGKLGNVVLRTHIFKNEKHVDGKRIGEFKGLGFDQPHIVNINEWAVSNLKIENIGDYNRVRNLRWGAKWFCLENREVLR